MALNNSRLIAYVEGGFLLILLLLSVQQLSGLGSGTTEEGLRALPPGPMRADADTCELQRHQNVAVPANVGITTGKAHDSPDEGELAQAECEAGSLGVITVGYDAARNDIITAQIPRTWRQKISEGFDWRRWQVGILYGGCTTNCTKHKH